MGVAPHFGMTGMDSNDIIMGYTYEGITSIILTTQNGNNVTGIVAPRFTSSMELYISGHYRVA